MAVLHVQSQVHSGEHESHRKFSEAGHVQICTVQKILLAAIVEEGPERESGSRDSQGKQAKGSPSSAHCHGNASAGPDPGLGNCPGGQVSRGVPRMEQVRRKGGRTPSLLDKLLHH